MNKNHCFVLGKGYGEPVAMEGALKLKEMTYIHAEGYSGGALKHGPFALIDDSDVSTLRFASKTSHGVSRGDSITAIFWGSCILVSNTEGMDEDVVPA